MKNSVGASSWFFRRSKTHLMITWQVGFGNMARNQGRGYVALICRKRQARAEQLAAFLWDFLIAEWERYEATGEIFPRGTWRAIGPRMGFISLCEGRFYTKQVCEKAIRLLVCTHELLPVRPCGESIMAWTRRQALRLKVLGAAAKKQARQVTWRISQAAAAAVSARLDSLAMGTVDPSAMETCPIVRGLLFSFWVAQVWGDKEENRFARACSLALPCPSFLSW